MRKAFVSVLGAVLALTMVVSTASAQMAPFNVGIFVGALFPSGELSGTTDLSSGDIAVSTGWVAGASGDYRFNGGTSPISVRLDLAYSSSSVRDDPNQPQIPIDGKLNNIYGMAYLLIHPNIGQADGQAKMDLYAGGGGGFVNTSLSGSTFSGAPSSTDGALSAVVGGAAPIGGVYLFFEGRWVVVFSEGTSLNLFPVVAGVRIPFGG